jgi:hypothetical protein
VLYHLDAFSRRLLAGSPSDYHRVSAAENCPFPTGCSAVAFLQHLPLTTLAPPGPGYLQSTLRLRGACSRSMSMILPISHRWALALFLPSPGSAGD